MILIVGATGVLGSVLSKRLLENGGQVRVMTRSPENWTNMEVAALYEKLAGRKAKLNHVPCGVLQVISGVLRPFHPGLSQVMQFSLWANTTDQTFDISETLQQFPMTLTKLEDWIRDRVSSEGVPAVGVA